jgi:Asp-tRNA(Asn)/Glu-tRNA(Gln) amidotransferase A subunit family amidase
MAIPWLVALKVIPWGDVIEHAPKVLSAARKLMDRQRAEPPPPAGDRVADSPPSLGELRVRLIAAQDQIDQQAQTQKQLAQTLAELAEQNARLVSAVEVLRVRSRLLLWGVVLLVIWTAWLGWR